MHFEKRPALGGKNYLMPTTYRIVKETHVVLTKDGKPDLIAIPEGSIITVEEPHSTQQTELVPVQFGSVTVKMFAVDLERRAEVVA